MRRRGRVRTLLMSATVMATMACSRVPEQSGASPRPETGGHDGNLTSDSSVHRLPGGLDVLWERDRPGDIVVDDENLYWTEGSAVFRGPKVGGRVGKFGPQNTTPGNLYSDGSHLYWLAGDHIAKISKSDETVTELPLGGDYFYGTVSGYGDWLYVADGGCRSIVILSKDGQNRTTWPVQPQVKFGGGFTQVRADAQGVYCASGALDQVFSMPAAGGKATTLVPGPTTNTGFGTGGIALVGEQAYFLNGNSALRKHYLVRVPKVGGTSENVVEVGSGSGQSPLEFDSTRQRFYWVTGTSQRDGVMSYSLADKTVEQVAQNRFTTRLTADQNYLYWTEFTAILRKNK